MIDWQRLAEPQIDGYDTAVTLMFAGAERSPRYGDRYVRRDVADLPVLFDGRVAVRYLLPDTKPPVAPRHVQGGFNAAKVGRAIDHLRCWPLGFEQFKAMMDTFSPIVEAMPATVPPDFSSSHSDEEFFGSMYATCHDPVALAECFVHEMAHNKLRALGVGVASAGHLVMNPPDELFVSPIIKHCKRPMTAVLHATYSFIYVTALDVHVVMTANDSKAEHGFAGSLEKNLARISEGLDEVRRNIQLDDAGTRFVDGMIGWGDRVVAAAESLVGRQ